ncbi:MAG: restriction endonuclease subunit S, partial [Alkalibacterium sp.]|nr:restriction endonuclease subunit S [Alkalibacterium sp.]
VRRNLDMNMFMEIVIKVPSYKEQEKIGNFFKKLDTSIALKEEKIESLKQMKKAFLQKMFV